METRYARRNFRTISGVALFHSAVIRVILSKFAWSPSAGPGVNRTQAAFAGSTRSPQLVSYKPARNATTNAESGRVFHWAGGQRYVMSGPASVACARSSDRFIRNERAQ